MSHDLDLARELMTEYAERSGLSGICEPHRYLWTDAHGVCNYLSLWRATKDTAYLDMAQALVMQVHEVLGRHRPDDSREGWLSGLSHAEARLHPTAAGLRIGKERPEREIYEAIDEQAEWDRDGQYFHYLTKWAHALLAMDRNTGNSEYGRWAKELMTVAYESFRAPDEPPRLFWKMRIDLSAPLTSGSSPTDALDGAITCLTLAAGHDESEQPSLQRTTSGLLHLSHLHSWQTSDPLGLGGLLFDAARLLQLPAVPTVRNRPVLLESILRSALEGIADYYHSPALSLPVEQRLAFRELGLVIGLKAISLAPREHEPDATCLRLLQRIGEYQTLVNDLLTFWVQQTHRHTASWLAHEDINSVMLASCLAPQELIACS